MFCLLSTVQRRYSDRTKLDFEFSVEISVFKGLGLKRFVFRKCLYVYPFISALASKPLNLCWLNSHRLCILSQHVGARNDLGKSLKINPYFIKTNSCSFYVEKSLLSLQFRLQLIPLKRVIYKLLQCLQTFCSSIQTTNLILT